MPAERLHAAIVSQGKVRSATWSCVQGPLLTFVVDAFAIRAEDGMRMRNAPRARAVRIDGPRLMTEAELRAALAPPVFCSAPLAAFPGAVLALPSAVLLARVAEAGRGIVSTGELEPIYLREPHITLPKARL